MPRSAVALPLLLLAACPLSMLVMMPLMMRGMGGTTCATEPDRSEKSPAAGRTHEQQVAALRQELVDVQTRQHALAEQLAQLDPARPPAVREAEAVARAADDRR